MVENVGTAYEQYDMHFQTINTTKPTVKKVDQKKEKKKIIIRIQKSKKMCSGHLLAHIASPLLFVS